MKFYEPPLKFSLDPPPRFLAGLMYEYEDYINESIGIYYLR